MSVPSEEEYIAWREDRVTRWILAVCRKTAGEVFDSWVQRSWQANELDPLDHIVARTRADAYLGLEQSDYSDWVAKADDKAPEIALPTRNDPHLDGVVHIDSTGNCVGMLILLVVVAFVSFAMGAVLV